MNRKKGKILRYPNAETGLALTGLNRQDLLSLPDQNAFPEMEKELRLHVTPSQIWTTRRYKSMQWIVVLSFQ